MEETDKEKENPCIKIIRNKMQNGCTVTAYNLHEELKCDICEHKDKWNCISLKINDVMVKK